MIKTWCLHFAPYFLFLHVRHRRSFCCGIYTIIIPREGPPLFWIISSIKGNQKLWINVQWSWLKDGPGDRLLTICLLSKDANLILQVAFQYLVDRPHSLLDAFRAIYGEGWMFLWDTSCTHHWQKLSSLSKNHLHPNRMLVSWRLQCCLLSSTSLYFYLVVQWSFRKI